jgi:RimJ/RimL family protein N-acetyltransferase
MLPEHRGRGLGTAAQRVLVEHLWTTTQVHRIQARTEAENIAEQRALEKIGFEREGRMREVLYRAGRWRDGLMYGLLRPDAP